MRYCNIERCVKKVSPGGARGLCPMHYVRLKKWGDPHKPTRYDKRPAIIEGGIAKIPLGIKAKYGYAIVDKDYARLDKYKWNLDKNGYPIWGRAKRLHSFIKPSKVNFIVDHKDGDKLNNRSKNLRYATHRLNSINSKLDKRNTSGYKGVTKVKKYWDARITVRGKRYLLGSFYNLEEAIAARKVAERKYNYYDQV